MTPRLPAAALALSCALAGCGAHEPGGAISASFDPDSIPDAYARSTAALWWPGTTRGVQVTPGGDLFNGAWLVRVSPSVAIGAVVHAPSAAPPNVTRSAIVADPPRVIAYEDRWLPIARWNRRAGPVQWRFEAVGVPAPAPRDTELVVSLVAEASNGGASPCEASLELRFATPDSSAAFFAWDAPEHPGSLDGWGSDPAACLGLGSGTASGASSVVRWPLAPGGRRTARFVLASYPAPLAMLRGFARIPHAGLAARVRDHWTRALRAGTRFELGDPELERALDAAVVTLLSSRERRGDDWIPIGGPYHYRDVWLRDGAREIQALALAGHVEEACDLARGLLLLQWPNGAFLSQRGQLDGTGQALWAFDQCLSRASAPGSLEPFAAAAERAVRWCEAQRTLERSRTAARLGLLPPAEPRDNELVRGRLVGSDAWAIAGYRGAARVLRAAGRSALADSVEAWRASYVSDFVRAAESRGGSRLPPSWDAGGRDWGNFAVGYPCVVVEPGDPRRPEMDRLLRETAARAWRASGGVGLAGYGAPDSLHGYLGADLGTAALLTGRREEADSVLAALVRWRSASGGAAELFSRSSRDFGDNLPPHPTCAAALVTLVRNALIFDDGDTLSLTLGARGAWWKGARVLQAPTRWGLVGLAFSRGGDIASWTWTAVRVPARLALPPGTVVTAAEPPLQAAAGADFVIAPPGATHAEVRVRASSRGGP